MEQDKSVVWGRLDGACMLQEDPHEEEKSREKQANPQEHLKGAVLTSIRTNLNVHAKVVQKKSALTI